MRTPWFKFGLGFLGWFLITLPVINFPKFLFGAYVPLNLTLAALLLLLRRTRLVGLGMAGAMAVNFVLSSILGTITPPTRLAPVIHPNVFHYRWNLALHRVSGDISQGSFADCIPEATLGDLPALDRAAGRIAYESWRLGGSEIRLMDLDGSEQVKLTGESEGDTHPAWSPDGERIAFTSFLPEGNMEVYVMNADGSGRIRLTDNPAMDAIPTWSPDGMQIAFISNRDGNLEIYAMDADGSDQRNLTRHPNQDSNPAWSPDGRQIAFDSDRGNPEGDSLEATAIYVMDSDGTAAKRVTGDSVAGFRPAWSPNSRCLVYQSGLSLHDWIMLVKLDGSEPVELVHAGSYPRWSPDGTMVVYSVIHGEWNLEIHTLDLNTLQTSRLTYNNDHDANPAWKP
jgi:TolB protein